MQVFKPGQLCDCFEDQTALGLTEVVAFDTDEKNDCAVQVTQNFRNFIRSINLIHCS